MNRFEKSLQGDAPVILDGGLATQLESMGFDIDGVLWSAHLLVKKPRAIVDAHRAYLDAGADCIISASYQASRAGFMSLGQTATQADELIASSVELALIARSEFLEANPEKDNEPIVAASVGPFGATMNDGSEYTGVYSVTEQELREFHLTRLEVLVKTGADVIACETIPNFTEAGILCVLLADIDKPAWVSFACRDHEHLSDGTKLMEAAGLFADHANVHALGINCTAPELISSLIPLVRKAAPNKAIVVYPNSGETFHAEDNSWSGAACDFENDFAVEDWRRGGAKLIGGCCRTGPADIAAIRGLL